MIRPKKSLGQHFLRDRDIAGQIASSLSASCRYVLEVGPGEGALTHFLLEKYGSNLKMIEIDAAAVSVLKKSFPAAANNIIHADFLCADLSKIFPSEFSVIGNFPYNISSQIVFKIIEHRNAVTEMVGMFQKEMAERIVAKEGSRTYGRISVMTRAFYECEYILTVDEHAFSPEPKIKSGVIKMVRKKKPLITSDEKTFSELVKHAFSQRRKTLRNALKTLAASKGIGEFPYMKLRAEQLSVEQFDELAKLFWR